MEVISVSNEDFLLKLLNKDDNKLKVIYFYTEASEECEQISDVLEELVKSGDYKEVTFMKVKAFKHEAITAKYEITSVPTIIFYLKKQVLDKQIGANVPSLSRKLNDCAQKAHQAANDSSTDLNTHLKKLINRAPIMLFMKGNRDMPRCGFSQKTLALLESCNAHYETFDILEDMEVREGLKEYSNWPTYPQLYVNGELIGGYDIIKELSESGELASAISTEDINERLKELINKAPVMVFMKGSPETPRCGFSKNLVAMLNETGVPYSTFDILEDNSVREGLKKFSNWPTYPQVYVKGDLIGGFDIIKELKENGELKSALEGN